jgi:peptidoglycan DL-endopeptidase CwlO
MQPLDPQVRSADARRARSLRFWKVLVATAAGAALSAVAVASCLDARLRDDRDDDDVVSVVTTTAAELPAGEPSASLPPAEPSATVVIAPAEVGAATTAAEQAPAEPAAPAAPAEPMYYVIERQLAAPQSAPAADVAPMSSVAPAAVTESTAPTTAVASVDAADAGTAPPVRRDARGNPIDPANQGSNPNAPAMSAGAGQFTTESPPWAASAFTSNPDAGAGRFSTDAPPSSASSFTSNPNAGAGPFTTEWNIPAYGYWPY